MERIVWASKAQEDGVRRAIAGKIPCEQTKQLAREFNYKGRLGLGAGELTASYLFDCLREGTTLPIQTLKHPDEKSELIYKNVSAWLSEITYAGAEITASEKSSDKLELFYSFNKGKFRGNDFSPLNVGFGFSYVLPVILAVLSAKPGSLILIENPEAHLHPAAQSRLGRLLAMVAKYGVQVIIETHSEHIVNGARLSVLKEDIEPKDIVINFFSTNTEGGPSQQSLQVKEDGELSEWPVNFFDQAELDFIEILRLKGKR